MDLTLKICCSAAFFSFFSLWNVVADLHSIFSGDGSSRELKHSSIFGRGWLCCLVLKQGLSSTTTNWKRCLHVHGIRTHVFWFVKWLSMNELVTRRKRRKLECRRNSGPVILMVLTLLLSMICRDVLLDFWSSLIGTFALLLGQPLKLCYFLSIGGL